MAEGLARHLSGPDICVSSGGSEPAMKINEKAVKVMEEKGTDISSQKPTEIEKEDAKSADFVITMGCGPEACPVPVDSKSTDWKIEDPSGEPTERFREVRDKIEEKVRNLLEKTSD